jgi:uncharacterized membrane protein
MIKRLLGLFHKTASWYERYFIWLVVGAAVLAMAIGLSIGLMQSVWFDEAYSILLAKQPVVDLIHLTSLDTHPPLYYLLLKLWAGLFGWGEFALRSLSVLAMGGALAVGALLVKRLFGVKAAVMTLPFLVLAPFLLRYGFEIRMYSLASLIGVAATYVLVIAVETKNTKRQWLLYALYALFVALGMLTLYYTVLLWVAHVVWLVWLAIHKKESVFKQRWWLAYVGAVVLFLPWLPTFLKQMTNGALAPISQQLTADNMVGIASFWFLYQPSWQLSGILSLLVLAVFVTVAYIFVKLRKLVSPKQKPGLALLVCYAAVPVLMIALISLARPMYVERYLAHVLIGFGLLLGVAVWLLATKYADKARLLGLGLLAVLFLGVSQLVGSGNYNFQRLQHPQVKQAASIIDCTKGSLLAADPYVATELSYYMPNCDIHFYSDTPDLRGGYAPFANSSLRISNPEKELASKKQLTYVYYDKAELSLPAALHLNEDISFGPLHVSVFNVE